MRRSRPERPRLAVVTPVHNEADNLAAYEREVRRVLLSRSDLDVRVVLVDDGSQDGSWAIIEEMCRRDARFSALRLSRNFGSHAALSAALHQADGDAVAILAADLQDPPETVLEFVDKWQAGAQIVWGRRRTRVDPRWRIWSSRFFEALVRRFAMPSGSRFTTGSFLLMDRQVLECYRRFRETNRLTFALVAWTGFEQAVVDYDRRARVAGRSSWSPRRMFKAACDTFLASSAVPFGFIAAIGASLFLLGLFLSGHLALCYLTGDPKPGWVGIVPVLALCFGLHFIFMSIQGEYLARIHSEAVNRPLYVVSETTENLEKQFRDAA